MKHAGKATRAALKLIYWTLFFLLALMLAGVLARFLSQFIAEIAGGLVVLWLLFCGFCFFFFRDPRPAVPTSSEDIVAPAHGKVDVIDEVDEPEFMGGKCRRVSIFLSIFSVHVQNAPVAGTVGLCRHKPGRFVNALRTDSAKHNENVLIGIHSSERDGEKMAVRLIAGLIARRIMVWTSLGESLKRGERISLIQFGSRVDLYLPPAYHIEVKCGDHVRAGETIVAKRA